MGTIVQALSVFQFIISFDFSRVYISVTKIYSRNSAHQAQARKEINSSILPALILQQLMQLAYHLVFQESKDRLVDSFRGFILNRRGKEGKIPTQYFAFAFQILCHEIFDTWNRLFKRKGPDLINISTWTNVGKHVEIFEMCHLTCSNWRVYFFFLKM